MQPFISVIVPNYNHADFLKQRIDSILNQTYQHFEVILLDDASTDESKSIIENYRKHKKISHIIYNTVNSGNTFIQWNKGINIAKGDYIWIAESDDFCSTSFLEIIVQSLNESVVLAYTISDIIDENNHKAFFLGKERLPDGKKFEQSFYLSGITFIEKFLIHGNMIPNASSVVFSKKEYLSKCLSNEQFLLFGDWFTWLSLLNTEEKELLFLYNQMPLNYFRHHINTVRGNKYETKQTLWEYYSIYKELKKIFPQKRALFFDKLYYKYNEFMKLNILDKTLVRKFNWLLFKYNFYQFLRYKIR